MADCSCRKVVMSATGRETTPEVNHGDESKLSHTHTHQTHNNLTHLLSEVVTLVLDWHLLVGKQFNIEIMYCVRALQVKDIIRSIIFIIIIIISHR